MTAPYAISLPFPTFNRESAATPPAVDSAAALPPAPSAAADISIPDGYRLVKVETLQMLADELKRLKAIERLPAFLASPTREYLAAVRRA